VHYFNNVETATLMKKVDYASLQGESLTNSKTRPSEEIEERRSHGPTNVYKPNSQAVTLRLPDTMIEEIKQLARQRDTSFQTLVKAFLSEKLSEVK
jgi:predicted DNA binding CopG/RHH family protein